MANNRFKNSSISTTGTARSSSSIRNIGSSINTSKNRNDVKSDISRRNINTNNIRRTYSSELNNVTRTNSTKTEDRFNTTRTNNSDKENINNKSTNKKKKLDVRSIVMIACAVVAIGSFGYIFFYNYQAKHSSEQVDAISKVKDEDFVFYRNATVTLDNEDKPDILEEYLGPYSLNKKLVGWIKIDGTKVDYPVLQTSNNDYYLDHNFNQEADRNGSIFLDKDCSIWPRSQNLLLYGHNMRSGKMFGSLKSYKDEAFYKKHPQIQFDTIYEHGTYDIMYVFSEVVHDETEVAFKYYQFISANSEVEYDSYMNDMSAMSLYDTGVTSRYGDALITLSTCDYSQGAERFVIVAKKVN